MRMSNGILVSTLGAALLGSVSGCTCDTTVEPGIDAARPPPRDANTDVFSTDDAYVLEDGGSQSPDAPGVDAPLDAPLFGFDSGPGSSLTCRHSHAFGEDFWYLAQDTDVSVPSFTSVAARAGTFVGVYSSTERAVEGMAGPRRLEVFRYVAGVGGADPTVLAGGEGGSLPSVVSSNDGFWVAFSVGPEIRLARYRDDLTPIAPPVTIGSDALTTPARVATTTSGGYVVWVVGTTIRGRAIDTVGNPTGPAETLATATGPVQQLSIQRVGSSTELAVAWAEGGRPRVARLSGGTLGSAEFISSAPGIFTSIDMAGESARTMMAEPLAGAAVYDFDSSGARNIAFRILSGSPAVPTFPAARAVSTVGETAWSGSVEAFLSGYAIAYRARITGIEGTVLRVGYLDRNGCRLGTVNDQFVLGLVNSETGAVPQMATDEGTMLIVWSDERRGEYHDYFASVMTCMERS